MRGLFWPLLSFDGLRYNYRSLGVHTAALSRAILLWVDTDIIQWEKLLTGTCIDLTDQKLNLFVSCNSKRKKP